MDQVFYVLFMLTTISFINCTKIQVNNNSYHCANYSNYDKLSVSKPKNILELNSEEKEKFIKSFDLILTDCDGVLWRIQDPIEGVADGLNLLKQKGKKIAYLSNNSLRTEKDYLELFSQIGLETDARDIFHPLRNTVAYLKKIRFDGLIYCIGSTIFKEGLAAAGFRYIDGPNKIINESFRDLAMNVFDKEPVECVIVDYDYNINNAKLIRAQQYLKKPGTMFIVGATDLILPITPGIELLGPGGYIRMIQESTGKAPILMGKPGTKELNDIIVDGNDITDRKRTVMVGDMLQQDIGFGKYCGFQTLLVLTGGAKIGDFDKPEYSDMLPDYYTESLADFNIFFDTLSLKL